MVIIVIIQIHKYLYNINSFTYSVEKILALTLKITAQQYNNYE